MVEHSRPSAPADAAIEVIGVSKRFRIYRRPFDRLKELLTFGRSAATAAEEFVALDDVTFVVPRGETLGVIGRNGAGKSTLLQILCGTLKPTAGEVRVRGRISALLELGAGFNPEFTGRENVFLNASLLGLTRSETESRLDAIRDFAEIGEFFDQPVKTYSSGMYVRLAFAVAVHTDPEVLIVDEALAVGDIRFQQRCLERIEALRAAGATILFVSHSLEQVKRFCRSAIWLERGRVRLHGEASLVADRFRDSELGVDAEARQATTQIAPPVSITPAHILDVQVSRDTMAPFEQLRVSFEYEVLDESVPGLLAGVAIKGADGQHIFGPNTYLEQVTIPNRRGRFGLSYTIPSLPLLGGTYYIDVGLFSDRGLVCLDYRSRVAPVTVASPYFSEGLVYITHEWTVHE